MDDRELFEILENQGPWNIHFQDSLGKIFFSNGKVIIEVRLEIEESVDSAPVLKWNGTLLEN